MRESLQQPRRIAMLSVHTCPLASLGGKKTGGMNVYVRELSAELGRRGIFVDVFTRSQDPCVPHVNDSDLGPNARVIHIPAGPEIPLNTYQIHEHLHTFTERVLSFAAEEGIQYDLIHSHYWLSGLVAEELREAWGIPYVQMFHTLGRMKNRIALTEGEIEPPLRIEAEQRIIQSADWLVAATPAERVQLMWLYGAKMDSIHVISPGVDTNRFFPMPMDEARKSICMDRNISMLLFVGRIEPLKGLDTLLRAVDILRNAIPEKLSDFKLLIIGGSSEPNQCEDPEQVKLMELSRELGLENHVKFLGAKDQYLLPYYYSAADVAIMPSHYESFGLAALEAMACGTPVVASEVGGLAYLVQDGVTGFHIPYRDAEECAGKIGLLLTNSDLRKEMSRQAAHYATCYAWPVITEQILRLYNAASRHTQLHPHFNPEGLRQ